MRFIDADALIEAFYKRKRTLDDEIYLRVPAELVYQIIGNAPTVEYPFYKEAYQTGYEEGKNERPQGEWVFTDDDYGFWHCNQCKTVGSPHNNFCQNCGASMNKENKE